MQIQDATTTQDQRKEIQEENDFEYFPTDFIFLKEHKGLRPGCIHLLISNSGSGKSCLMRKILIDTAQKKDVLLWLSEETKEDFLLATNDANIYSEIQKNIKIITEMSFDKKIAANSKSLYFHFEKAILSLNPKAVFLDNLTTSRMYLNLRPAQQDELIWDIKNLCAKHGCPIFIVMHTRSEFSNNRLLDDSDVRGSKTIANICEYLYLFQCWEIAGQIYPTLRIRKARKHRVENKMFRLNFSREKNLYISDAKMSFETFIENFKNKDGLEKKRKTNA